MQITMPLVSKCQDITSQTISVQCQAVISEADITYKGFSAVAGAGTAANGNGLLTLPSYGERP